MEQTLDTYQFKRPPDVPGIAFLIGRDVQHGMEMARRFKWTPISATRYTNESKDDIRLVTRVGEVMAHLPPKTRVFFDKTFFEREDGDHFKTEMKRLGYVLVQADKKEKVEGVEPKVSKRTKPK